MTKRISLSFLLVPLFGVVSLSACNSAAVTPSVAVTSLSVAPSELPNDETFKTYDSKLWDLLFDKDMVTQINIAPNQEIWMLTGRGNIVYGDKKQWMIFSPKDFGFSSDFPSDMAIASDGGVWIASRHAISHYYNSNWNAIKIPNFSETAFPRLAVSRNGNVWVAMSLCYCENSLRSFDGNQWIDVSIDSLSVKAHQVTIDANDNLWVTFGDGTGIASFDGSIWKVYRDKSIWSGYPNFVTRMAVDNQGNVFSLNESPLWIGQIDSQGNITKIPFSKNLYLNETRIRIFIDTNHNIWVNACLKDKGNSCISYYDGQKWTTFINLPFSTVADINEIDSSVMLFATEKGLYRYAPSK